MLCIYESKRFNDKKVGDDRITRSDILDTKKVPFDKIKKLNKNPGWILVALSDSNELTLLDSEFLICNYNSFFVTDDGIEVHGPRPAVPEEYRFVAIDESIDNEPEKIKTNTIETTPDNIEISSYGKMRRNFTKFNFTANKNNQSTQVVSTD